MLIIRKIAERFEAYNEERRVGEFNGGKAY